MCVGGGGRAWDGGAGERAVWWSTWHGWMDGWMSKSLCRHEEVDPSHLGGAVWCGAGIGGVEGAAAVDWPHR